MYEGFNAVGMTARPLCRPIRGRARILFALGICPVMLNHAGQKPMPGYCDARGV